MFMIFTLLFAAAAVMIGSAAPARPRDLASRNIVPVCGGYVENSGWEAVDGLLKKEGFGPKQPDGFCASEAAGARRDSGIYSSVPKKIV